jgi:hypothetical protein
LIIFAVVRQTILLDVSPPRLFLILIQGTLIFHRKDLHLQAVYILVKGGTLQIGTEAEPFEQQATITLYGMNKFIISENIWWLAVFSTKILIYTHYTD